MTVSNPVERFPVSDTVSIDYAEVAPGVKLCYQEQGNLNSPRKVIMIMGLFMPKGSWDLVLNSMLHQAPTDYHIVTFDNRGVGESDAPAMRYTTAMMANDSIALLDHFQWEKAHVVGVSMGGMIALELAAHAPERVASLSLIVTLPNTRSFMRYLHYEMKALVTMVRSSRHSAADRTNAQLKIFYPEEYLAQETEDGRSIRAILFDFHLSNAHHISPIGSRNQLLATITHHVSTDTLHTIRDAGFPILIIGSGQDKLINVANTKKLYQQLKSKHTMKFIFEDSGHGIIQQHRNEVATMLIQNFNTQKIKVYLLSSI